MYSHHSVSFDDSGLFSGLFLDYLKQSKKTKPYYEYSFEINGFKDFLNKNHYSYLNRNNLADIVLQQSKQVSNCNPLSLKNIELLKENNTYTVTTGHQLCLFTGPLYFIYKIISVIQLTEMLNNELNDHHFVPVYWMASEDHDAEEINHVYVHGKKITWNTEQKGAVGSFTTDGIDAAIQELESVLGNLPNASALIELLHNAYLKHSTLKDATRYLVNELFGKYGLVVVDGDDVAFKNQFKEEFKKDIFDTLSFQACSNTIQNLKADNYSIQVNPREINCFFIDKEWRTRIQKSCNNYQIVNSDKEFTRDELNELIDTHPEKISPNVVLRPLYQQKILPNIAYCGGPGELAYWLEYLELFKAYSLPYPVLVPRNFITLIDKITLQKFNKLGFNIADIFKEEQALIKEYTTNKGISVDLNNEKNELQAFYNNLSNKAQQADKTLEASVKAEFQKAMNGLLAIESKINKALKNKSDTELNQIKTVKAKLFPNQVPQERFENFSSYYARYGETWIESIYSATSCLTKACQVLTED
jgi:bacillithiol synthase